MTVVDSTTTTPEATRALTRARPLAYALLLAAALLAALLFKLRTDGIFACPAGGYAGGRYLADCAVGGYGDYDHGAFWYGLEPRSRRAAAEADVLFVGSSRLQLALSTRATEQWFASAAARYFLLGFSHSETTVFMQPLLKRMQPQPKAVVVNVDRFFLDRTTPPVQEIFNGSDAPGRYREKRFWQALHEPLCSRIGALCGQQFATYRAHDTGAWQQLGKRPDTRQPVTDGAPSNREQWPDYVRLGEAFIAALPVERRCVLLTLVPSVNSRRAEAEAIAAALKMELVAPTVAELRTFDGSHLDAPSAERWSAAFFEAAGARLRQCLRR